MARRPTYGYALVEQLRRWPSFDSLAPPRRSIYEALRSLSSDRLIEPQNAAIDREPDGPSRRRFAATAEGERRYEEWLQSSPDTFSELCLRIGTARRKDVPALIEVVVRAEHEWLAYHRELRAPEVETVVAKGASWEAISVALLAAAEYSVVAARVTILSDMRRVLEDLLTDDGPEVAE